MNKKLIVSVLCLLLVCSCVLGLAACNKDDGGGNDIPTPVEKTMIVTVGDSIAEALAGPSPLSERENYGYYALVGKGNDYKYYNFSVSGHKSDQLLTILNKTKDDTAETIYSKLKQADIIQVSILGNDLLQDNLGNLLTYTAQYIEEIIAIAGNEGLKNADNTPNLSAINEYVHEHIKQEDGGGSHKLDYVKKLLYTNPADNAIKTPMGEFYGNSTVNIEKIVARLEELNPDATMLFQTIYNPVFDTSGLVSDIPAKNADKSAREILADYGYTSDEYRALGDILIEMLNNVIRDYLVAHPGAFTIVEVHDTFEEYYNDDASDGTAYARRLYSQDSIHPSNEGHAWIADITQKELAKLGLATDASYIASTKAIRCEQIDRMYSYTGCEVNAADAKAAINAATTAEAANLAYFNAITTDDYQARVTARNANKVYPIYPWVVPNYCGNKD